MKNVIYIEIPSPTPENGQQTWKLIGDLEVGDIVMFTS